MAAIKPATRPDGTTVELETFTQPRYRCPSCRRSWASSTACREHIQTGCWHDPTNRGCRTCSHYRPGEEVIDARDPGTETSCDVGAPDTQPMGPDGERVYFGGDHLQCDYWGPK